MDHGVIYCLKPVTSGARVIKYYPSELSYTIKRCRLITHLKLG